MGPDDYTRPELLRNPQSSTANERSAASIVSDLWQNTEHLLNEELELLRADVDQRTVQARKDLIELSLAGGVAYAGMLALMAALILALMERMQNWLAALLVGGVVLALGFAMFMHSKHKLAQRDLAPRTSIENIETTTHRIKEALR